MKFEQLLNNFDAGVCVDQLQNESLVDLAVLLVSIDGQVCDQELAVLTKWVDTLAWRSEVSAELYVDTMLGQCKDVIAQGHTESFIHHRMKNIVDESAKVMAHNLTTQLAAADGEISESEARAIKVIESEL